MRPKVYKLILKKVLIKIIIFMVIILFILFLFFIPDLILAIRSHIYTNFKIESNIKISSNSYVQMMISIFSCFVTAILGFCTYYLTKLLRRMEAEKRNSKLATSAFRIRKNIEHNCWIIFNAKNNVSTLNGLLYDSTLEEEWFNLSTAGELSNNEIKFLEKYNSQILDIADYIKKEKETKELEKNFCDAFLQGTTIFKYKEEIQMLLDKLKKIYERGEKYI